MSFDSRETSVQSGEPVYLYELSYGVRQWRYTSSPLSVTRSGKTFVPRPITHSDIQPSQEIGKANVTLTLAGDDDISDVFRIQPPSESVLVAITCTHVGDTDVAQMWSGRVVDWSMSPAQVELTCDSNFTSIASNGVPGRFSPQCPHTLYSTPCGVNRELVKVTGVVSEIDGLTVTVIATAGEDDNWFNGGLITWVNNTHGNVEHRDIAGSVGSTGLLTLTAQPRGLGVGDEVFVYPGCDHILATCNSKFSNSLNFGGTPFIPTQNPFGNAPLF